MGWLAMTDLLYIDCCIRGEQSRTKKLAEAFLAELAQRASDGDDTQSEEPT